MKLLALILLAVIFAAPFVIELWPHFVRLG